MAYNNNFPMGYQPMYYPQYQQSVQQPVQQMNTQQTQPQIQNGGFVSVQSEKEAQDYLVANGTSVTFVDPTNKKVYVKTRGFSSFDAPVFERYKLVKDEEEQQSQTINTEYASKVDIQTLQTEIEEIQNKIKKFTEKSVVNE